jgi:hypothetical protein
MSGNKAPRRRKAGEPVYPQPEPALRLIKPDSECSTTSIITELSQEAKEMLQDTHRKRQARSDDDTPDAA